MKKIVVFCMAPLAFSAVAGSEVNVELVSGFHASAHPAVAIAGGGKAYAYGVRGGTLMETQGGKRFRFSVDCTGLDRMMGDKTTGNGHCAWSDVDGDSIYVSLKTGEQGNHYTLEGGTGKWANASGSLETSFTYLPSPSDHLYLGVEEGRGTISSPAGGK